MKTQKTVYTCTECDHQSPRWLGKCPACGAWNSFEEESYTNTRGNTSSPTLPSSGEKAVLFRNLDIPEYMRCSTGISELDRVLGGGLVVGSAILIAGEPGIGKSTLLMQLCGKLGDDSKIMYVSGEESSSQLKLRAKRLDVDPAKMYVHSEVLLENIIKEYETVKPDIIIIDSIQTLVAQGVSSGAGSVTQVRECANRLIAKIKADGTSLIIVGHVNKEGGIAGPKVLEHMVDAVLSFEGERSQTHRIVRAIKNRFGSTNEIGVFDMTSEGLIPVDNPSAMLLEGRPDGISGSCAVCILEGTRPIIAEIQALVTPTSYPSPRRTADGIDYNRMCLILAVIEKRLGLRLSGCDVFMNVVGGMKIDDPAADAAIILAVVSSMKDIPVPHELIAMGEIGLAGEFRSVASVHQRISEAKRLGFTEIAVPLAQIRRDERKVGTAMPHGVSGMRGIYDALRILAQSQKSGEE